uniref:WD_REPEATS_REGION domain-containing protein n=1 Tax=Rhabditophanes sp. KR3021 TaxID=114890 RepID=A0AC35U7Y3_9BILA
MPPKKNSVAQAKTSGSSSNATPSSSQRTRSRNSKPAPPSVAQEPVSSPRKIRTNKATVKSADSSKSRSCSQKNRSRRQAEASDDPPNLDTVSASSSRQSRSHIRQVNAPISDDTQHEIPNQFTSFATPLISRTKSCSSAKTHTPTPAPVKLTGIRMISSASRVRSTDLGNATNSFNAPPFVSINPAQSLLENQQSGAGPSGAVRNPIPPTPCNSQTRPPNVTGLSSDPRLPIAETPPIMPQQNVTSSLATPHPSQVSTPSSGKVGSKNSSGATIIPPSADVPPSRLLIQTEEEIFKRPKHPNHYTNRHFHLGLVNKPEQYVPPNERSNHHKPHLETQANPETEPNLPPPIPERLFSSISRNEETFSDVVLRGKPTYLYKTVVQEFHVPRLIRSLNEPKCKPTPDHVTPNVMPFKSQIGANGIEIIPTGTYAGQTREVINVENIQDNQWCDNEIDLNNKIGKTHSITFVHFFILLDETIETMISNTTINPDHFRAGIYNHEGTMWKLEAVRINNILIRSFVHDANHPTCIITFFGDLEVEESRSGYAKVDLERKLFSNRISKKRILEDQILRDLNFELYGLKKPAEAKKQDQKVMTEKEKILQAIDIVKIGGERNTDIIEHYFQAPTLPTREMKDVRKARLTKKFLGTKDISNPLCNLALQAFQLEIARNIRCLSKQNVPSKHSRNDLIVKNRLNGMNKINFTIPKEKIYIPSGLILENGREYLRFVRACAEEITDGFAQKMASSNTIPVFWHMDDLFNDIKHTFFLMYYQMLLADLNLIDHEVQYDPNRIISITNNIAASQVGRKIVNTPSTIEDSVYKPVININQDEKCNMIIKISYMSDLERRRVEFESLRYRPNYGDHIRKFITVAENNARRATHLIMVRERNAFPNPKLNERAFLAQEETNVFEKLYHIELKNRNIISQVDPPRINIRDYAAKEGAYSDIWFSGAQIADEKILTKLYADPYEYKDLVEASETEIKFLKPLDEPEPSEPTSYAPYDYCPNDEDLESVRPQSPDRYQESRSSMARSVSRCPSEDPTSKNEENKFVYTGPQFEILSGRLANIMKAVDVPLEAVMQRNCPPVRKRRVVQVDLVAAALDALDVDPSDAGNSPEQPENASHDTDGGTNKPGRPRKYHNFSEYFYRGDGPPGTLEITCPDESRFNEILNVTEIVPIAMEIGNVSDTIKEPESNNAVDLLNQTTETFIEDNSNHEVDHYSGPDQEFEDGNFEYEIPESRTKERASPAKLDTVSSTTKKTSINLKRNKARASNTVAFAIDDTEPVATPPMTQATSSKICPADDNDVEFDEPSTSSFRKKTPASQSIRRIGPGVVKSSKETPSVISKSIGSRLRTSRQSERVDIREINYFNASISPPSQVHEQLSLNSTRVSRTKSFGKKITPHNLVKTPKGIGRLCREIGIQTVNFTNVTSLQEKIKLIEKVDEVTSADVVVYRKRGRRGRGWDIQTSVDFEETAADAITPLGNVISIPTDIITLNSPNEVVMKTIQDLAAITLHEVTEANLTPRQTAVKNKLVEAVTKTSMYTTQHPDNLSADEGECLSVSQADNSTSSSAQLPNEVFEVIEAYDVEDKLNIVPAQVHDETEMSFEAAFGELSNDSADTTLITTTTDEVNASVEYKVSDTEITFDSIGGPNAMGDTEVVLTTSTHVEEHSTMDAAQYASVDIFSDLVHSQANLRTEIELSSSHSDNVDISTDAPSNVTIDVYSEYSPPVPTMATETIMLCPSDEVVNLSSYQATTVTRTVHVKQVRPLVTMGAENTFTCSTDVSVNCTANAATNVEVNAFLDQVRPLIIMETENTFACSTDVSASCAANAATSVEVNAFFNQVRLIAIMETENTFTCSTDVYVDLETSAASIIESNVSFDETYPGNHDETNGLHPGQHYVEAQISVNAPENVECGISFDAYCDGHHLGTDFLMPTSLDDEEQLNVQELLTANLEYPIVIKPTELAEVPLHLIDPQFPEARDLENTVLVRNSIILASNTETSETAMVIAAPNFIASYLITNVSAGDSPIQSINCDFSFKVPSIYHHDGCGISFGNESYTSASLYVDNLDVSVNLLNPCEEYIHAVVTVFKPIDVAFLPVEIKGWPTWNQAQREYLYEEKVFELEVDTRPKVGRISDGGTERIQPFDENAVISKDCDPTLGQFSQKMIYKVINQSMEFFEAFLKQNGPLIIRLQRPTGDVDVCEITKINYDQRTNDGIPFFYPCTIHRKLTGVYIDSLKKFVGLVIGETMPLVQYYRQQKALGVAEKDIIFGETTADLERVYPDDALKAELLYLERQNRCVICYLQKQENWYESMKRDMDYLNSLEDGEDCFMEEEISLTSSQENEMERLMNESYESVQKFKQRLILHNVDYHVGFLGFGARNRSSVAKLNEAVEKQIVYADDYYKFQNDTLWEENWPSCKNTFYPKYSSKSLTGEKIKPAGYGYPELENLLVYPAVGICDDTTIVKERKARTHKALHRYKGAYSCLDICEKVFEDKPTSYRNADVAEFVIVKEYSLRNYGHDESLSDMECDYQEPNPYIVRGVQRYLDKYNLDQTIDDLCKAVFEAPRSYVVDQKIRIDHPVYSKYAVIQPNLIIEASARWLDQSKRRVGQFQGLFLKTRQSNLDVRCHLLESKYLLNIETTHHVEYFSFMVQVGFKSDSDKFPINYYNSESRQSNKDKLVVPGRKRSLSAQAREVSENIYCKFDRKVRPCIKIVHVYLDYANMTEAIRAEFELKDCEKANVEWDVAVNCTNETRILHKLIGSWYETLYLAMYPPKDDLEYLLHVYKRNKLLNYGRDLGPDFKMIDASDMSFKKTKWNTVDRRTYKKHPDVTDEELAELEKDPNYIKVFADKLNKNFDPEGEIVREEKLARLNRKFERTKVAKEARIEVLGLKFVIPTYEELQERKLVPEEVCTTGIKGLLNTGSQIPNLLKLEVIRCGQYYDVTYNAMFMMFPHYSLRNGDISNLLCQLGYKKIISEVTNTCEYFVPEYLSKFPYSAHNVYVIRKCGEFKFECHSNKKGYPRLVQNEMLLQDLKACPDIFDRYMEFMTVHTGVDEQEKVEIVLCKDGSVWLPLIVGIRKTHFYQTNTYLCEVFVRPVLFIESEGKLPDGSIELSIYTYAVREQGDDRDIIDIMKCPISYIQILQDIQENIIFVDNNPEATFVQIPTVGMDGEPLKTLSSGDFGQYSNKEYNFMFNIHNSVNRKHCLLFNNETKVITIDFAELMNQEHGSYLNKTKKKSGITKKEPGLKVNDTVEEFLKISNEIQTEFNLCKAVSKFTEENRTLVDTQWIEHFNTDLNFQKGFEPPHPGSALDFFYNVIENPTKLSKLSVGFSTLIYFVKRLTTSYTDKPLLLDLVYSKELKNWYFYMHDIIYMPQIEIKEAACSQKSAYRNVVINPKDSRWSPYQKVFNQYREPELDLEINLDLLHLNIFNKDNDVLMEEIHQSEDTPMEVDENPMIGEGISINVEETTINIDVQTGETLENSTFMCNDDPMDDASVIVNSTPKTGRERVFYTTHVFEIESSLHSFTGEELTKKIEQSVELKREFLETMHDVLAEIDSSEEESDEDDTSLPKGIRKTIGFDNRTRAEYILSPNGAHYRIPKSPRHISVSPNRNSTPNNDSKVISPDNDNNKSDTSGNEISTSEAGDNNIAAELPNIEKSLDEGKRIINIYWIPKKKLEDRFLEKSESPELEYSAGLFNTDNNVSSELINSSITESSTIPGSPADTMVPQMDFDSITNSSDNNNNILVSSVQMELYQTAITENLNIEKNGVSFRDLTKGTKMNELLKVNEGAKQILDNSSFTLKRRNLTSPTSSIDKSIMNESLENCDEFIHIIKRVRIINQFDLESNMCVFANEEDSVNNREGSGNKREDSGNNGEDPVYDGDDLVDNISSTTETDLNKIIPGEINQYSLAVEQHALTNIVNIPNHLNIQNDQEIVQLISQDNQMSSINSPEEVAGNSNLYNDPSENAPASRRRKCSWTHADFGNLRLHPTIQNELPLKHGGVLNVDNEDSSTNIDQFEDLSDLSTTQNDIINNESRVTSNSVEQFMNLREMAESQVEETIEIPLLSDVVELEQPFKLTTILPLTPFADHRSKIDKNINNNCLTSNSSNHAAHTNRQMLSNQQRLTDSVREPETGLTFISTEMPQSNDSNSIYGILHPNYSDLFQLIYT